MQGKWMIALAAGASAVVGAAAAQPGPKILTTGSADARASMTPGATYESVRGVHVFRGTPAAAEAEPVPLAGGEAREIKIVVKHKYAWRSLRRLRTQGFYSGRDPKSRRYRQGFYSGM